MFNLYPTLIHFHKANANFEQAYELNERSANSATLRGQILNRKMHVCYKFNSILSIYKIIIILLDIVMCKVHRLRVDASAFAECLKLQQSATRADPAPAGVWNNLGLLWLLSHKYQVIYDFHQGTRY